MTKEGLIVELTDVAREVSAYRIDGILQRFFNTNVCIPKGKDRHPYADVYHEAVEGKEWQWSKDGVNWYDVVPPRYIYRIKPSEPTFEWQYMYKNLLTNQYDITGYLSDDEYIESNNSWHKLEETKRERK
jgi:hypothetical protein